MRNKIFIAVAGALVCAATMATPGAAMASRIGMTTNLSSVARTPDRGTFMSYGATQPVQRGASTWHAVQLSEAHALAAIARGGMVISAPDGHPVPLRYVRSIKHADGNWSWIGRPVGTKPGTEALLTFGPKAVFGSIPNGEGLPLELTTVGGRTYLIETDAHKLSASAVVASGNDMVSAPDLTSSTRASITTTPAPSAAAILDPALTRKVNARVDLILGYTTGFATRLGGQSQAATRLHFMVDIANQAYANSGVKGQLVLLGTVEVNYPDDTQNRATLYALSGVSCTTTAAAGQHYLPDGGVNCTTVAPPAALQPLLDARQQYGADLVSLVRNYTVPQNQTCGVAWLLGAGQNAFTAGDVNFGLSVVSDSSGSLYPSNGNTCRNETLAHELGHNMGLAHDLTTAAGTDDSDNDGNLLDSEEYGRYADSFGYTTGAGAGNFYTIMAVPAPGQVSYRVFSNPQITTCGGFACGVAQVADNARTLNLTMPAVQDFRAPPPAPTPQK